MAGLLDPEDEAYLASLQRNQRLGVRGPVMPRGGGEAYGNPMTPGDLGRDVISGVNVVAQGLDPVRLGRGIESAVQGVRYPEGAVAYGPYGIDGAPAFRMRDGGVVEATAADRRHGGLFDLADLLPMAGVQGGPAGTLGSGARTPRRGRSRVVAPQSDEEIAQSFGMTVDELLQVRADNIAQSNRFNEPAERLRLQAEKMGFAAQVEAPGDTTSRYLRLRSPNWNSDVTIRIADHAQPMEYVADPRGSGGLVRMPVGGYSKELRARHQAADFSVDPNTRYTEADALEFLRGLLMRGLIPGMVGGGGAAGLLGGAEGTSEQ